MSLLIELLEGINLSKGKTDPYVEITFNGKTSKTKVHKKTINVDFNEKFDFKVVTPAASERNLQAIEFKIMDKDLVTADDTLGRFKIPLWTLESFEEVDGWYSLDPHGMHQAPREKTRSDKKAQLHLKIQYIDKVRSADLEKSRAGQFLIGDVVPDFTAPSNQGELTWHKYINDSWAVFCSHPADFTPVCTTELGYVGAHMVDFAKRHCKVAAISVDPVEDHHKWIKDIEETQKGAQVNYPIFADPKRQVANLYKMIHPNAADTKAGQMTVRSVFIIDNKKKLRATLTYPASTGRNFNEILRVIDSLQMTDNYKVATPANWNDGDDCVVLPSVVTEDAKTMFGDVNIVKPYLRMVKQPGPCKHLDEKTAAKNAGAKTGGPCCIVM